jgi:phospholipase/carboxylesterase
MTQPAAPANGLHQRERLLTAGAPLAQARAAAVLIHGRGASARDILTLAPELALAGVAYLAPQAAGSTWYPYPFMTSMEQNEPFLSSALARVGEVLAQVAAGGIPPERTVLLGFSQGACLTTEYVARHAQRYGGVAGLSGGLIGPAGTPRNYPGGLADTPVFLGCSDVDPHIPKERVIETGEVFKRLGAQVDLCLYPGMGHTINEDELAAVRALFTPLLAAA